VAEIVAAMAMTHSPGLTGWFTRASEDYQRLALQATAEMRRRLEAARPDVLLMFSNDHLLNWPINNVPEYTVGIADEHVGPADWFDEWLAMEQYRVPELQPAWEAKLLEAMANPGKWQEWDKAVGTVRVGDSHPVFAMGEKILRTPPEKRNEKEARILTDSYIRYSSQVVPEKVYKEELKFEELLKKLKEGGYKVVQVVGKTPVEPKKEYVDMVLKEIGGGMETARPMSSVIKDISN